MSVSKLEQLFETAPLLSLKKGQVLMFSGDELTHVYNLTSGYVKMYNVNEIGEQRILLIFPARFAFPIFPGITTRPHYKLRYFYEAMTEIQARRMPITDFASILEKNESVARFVLDYVTQLSGIVVRRLGIIENKEASRKIMNLLPYLASICGRKLSANVMQLDLRITHQDIAELTGLTRETVTKEMKKIVNQGVITRITKLDSSDSPVTLSDNARSSRVHCAGTRSRSELVL